MNFLAKTRARTTLSACLLIILPAAASAQTAERDALQYHHHQHHDDSEESYWRISNPAGPSDYMHVNLGNSLICKRVAALKVGGALLAPGSTPRRVFLARPNLSLLPARSGAAVYRRQPRRRLRQYDNPVL